MRDAAIFDLDGTLCDTTGVEHLLDGSEGSFAAFQAAAVACPPDPEVVAAAREQAARGRAVVVVTSREFVWHDHTLDWLVEHDVPHDAVYMRVVGDFRKDVVIKGELLDLVVADGYTPLEAWEDKDAVLELWAGRGLIGHRVG